MSMRYKGGVISATPPTISTTSAPGIWTLQQQFQNAGAWPPSPPSFDPYFEYVSMLLPGNGTNGAQNNTFLDSSTNAFSITRNGNTTQGTFSPYGNLWSNYFDGTGDLLYATETSSQFTFGTGDYTYECWIFPTTGASTQRTIFGRTNTGDTSVPYIYLVTTTGVVSVYYSSTIVSGTTAIPSNTWTHIVVSRLSGTTRIFVNGTQEGSASDTTNLTSPTSIMIGGSGASATNPFTGYISNVRILKGTGYSSITVPTTPLTAITNTSLLTCQSNRFIDNSTNAFTIGRDGNVSVQRFSPFNPTASYSTSTIGGSGYFDGTTDYLRVSSGTVGIANSAFTICLWFYPLSSSVIGLFDSDPNTGNCFRNYNTNTIEDQDTPGSVSFAGSYQVNAWNWMCITKSGTSFTVYINGTSVGTGTCSNAMSENEFTVGAINSGGDGAYNGYISDFQVLNTSTVVSPPTAPLTNASGKTLLLSMTNAGIIDNSMMNNLETVGNAQISTAQSKFGGGSMLFDGTGDWLRPPLTPQAALGSGDFTVEFWARVTDTGIAFDFCGTATWGNYIGAGKSGWSVSFASSLVSFSYQSNNSYVIATNFSGTGLSANTWYHIAIVRSSGVIKCYINGVASATTISSSADIASNTYGVWVGTAGDGDTYGYLMNGYIDDLRITKGYARYTANFTPSPYPFPTL